MGSVDVIVPCYRYGRYLRQCVQSVLAQPIASLRILIIDDASPDDTASVAAELVNADSRVQFVRHDHNHGHIATYNEGIEWASADYVLLLSADDYLLPHSLQHSVGLLDSNPTVSFVFGKAIELHEECPLQERTVTDSGCNGQRIVIGGLDFIQMAGSRNVVPTPTAVVRTALQKGLGGYWPDLPHSGDLEMWLRLAAHGAVGIIGFEQAVYRRHSTNMSLSYRLDSWLPDLQQRKAALDRFFETCSSVLPNAPSLSASLSRELARVAVGFASSAFNEGNTEAALRILEFGREVSPNVRWSFPWLRLAIKRQIGFGVWHAFRGASDAR